MLNRELIEQDLDEYVEGESWPAPHVTDALDPTTPVEPEPLTDEAEVQGVLRRLKRLDREAATITDVAKADIARITLWRDDRLAGIARDKAWGERAIEAYMRGRAVSQPRAKKSVSLPDGTPKLSKPNEKVEVTDKAAFLAWAVERTTIESDDATEAGETLRICNPSLVRVKLEPVKDALKALEHGTEETADGVVTAPLTLPGGELVPGVEVRRPAQDRFNVTLSAD